MNILIDLKILELLASKICHDLVSPVGAINNGVELIEDIGGDVTEEAMKLIGDSAGQAARRLRLFRLIYGRAGSESTLTFKEARATIEATLAHTKIQLSFEDESLPEELMDTPGVLKVLLNTILLAEEALIYGGTILVGHAKAPFIGGVTVKASGREAHLGEQSMAALKGEADTESVTPRSVHAYLSRQFMECFHFKFAVNESEDRSVFAIHFTRK